MKNIYDIQGNVLMQVPVTPECEHVEELMRTDEVRMFWNAAESAVIPAGAYVEVPDGEEKYYLVEPYKPTQRRENEWRYEPVFVSAFYALSKVPFYMYTYEGGDPTGQIISREADWVLTDTPANFMATLCRAIENETGVKYKYAVDAGLAASATITFSSVDIISALNAIANAFGTEFWLQKFAGPDASGAIGRIHLSFANDGATAKVLTVGTNVNVPSVSEGGEGFFNRFVVLGSSRNITQDYQGAGVNSVANKRLTLDPEDYPDGYIDYAGSGRAFTKILTFEDVYPSANLRIKANSILARLRYVIDDDTQEPITTSQYAIYYFQLERYEGGVWSDYVFNNEDYPDGDRLPGKAVSIHFQTGALRGREFELEYHETALTNVRDKADATPFSCPANCFEIVKTQEGTYVIPALTGLVPSDNDEVIIFNIAMPSTYIKSAQERLETAAFAEIGKRYLQLNADGTAKTDGAGNLLRVDLNSYQLTSNPVAFNASNPGLKIASKVTYVNGSYSLSTRVKSLVTKLDFPVKQTVTIGQELTKGTIQELKEEAANANQNIDLLDALNASTKTLLDAYNRTQEFIQAGMVDNFFEVGSPSTMVQLKSQYQYLGPRKGLIFDSVLENDTSDADLYVKWVGEGANRQRVLYSPLALITEKDQIVGGGTPGGGGGGDSKYLNDLLDVTITNPSNGQALVYQNGEWVNGSAIPDLSDYYTKTQTDAQISSAITALNLGAAATYGIGSVASGNTGLVTGGSVYSAINSALSSVLKFVGVTTTEITDGSTTNPVIINGSSYTAVTGNVVLYGAKEYLWTGSAWEEMGDEASWALKTITITAGTGLTGGGNLTANRTLSLSQATRNSLALADSAIQPSDLKTLTVQLAGTQIGSYTPAAAATINITKANLTGLLDDTYHPYGGGNIDFEAKAVTTTGNITLQAADRSIVMGAEGSEAVVLRRNASYLMLGSGTYTSLPTLIYGTPIRFYTYGTTAAERMRILANGRVAINSTTSSYQLYVNGTLGVSGLSTLTGGATIPATASMKIGDATITWVANSGNGYLKIDKPLLTEGDQIVGSGTPGGGGGGGVTLYSYDQIKAMTSEVSLTAPSAWAAHQMYLDYNGRLASLEGGSAMNFTTTGSGNVVTAISKSGTTVTVTKGLSAVSKAGDTMTGSLTFSQGSNTRRNGIVGTYDSTKVAAIWAMGSSYQIAADGSGFGNLYGLAYMHVNSGLGTYAGTHQVVWATGGTIRVSLGQDGVWVNGGFIKNGSSDDYFLLGGGGHVARSTYALASSLANYLPLSGGTLSSSLVYSLNLNNEASGATGVGIRFRINSTEVGNLYVSSTNILMFNDTTSYRTIYHSGNFVAGTNYVSISGAETITGAKTFTGAILSIKYDNPRIGFYTSAGTLNGVIAYRDTVGPEIYNGSNWYRMYHSGNSNLTSINWSAKSLTLAGAITGATTGAFSSDVTVGGDLYLSTNGNGIYFKDTGDTKRLAILLSTSNILAIGTSTSAGGCNTILQGNTLYLRYGTSVAIGAILNSSGNLTIGSSDLASTSYKLYVNGDAAVNNAIYFKYAGWNSLIADQKNGGLRFFTTTNADTPATQEVLRLNPDKSAAFYSHLSITGSNIVSGYYYSQRADNRFYMRDTVTGDTNTDRIIIRYANGTALYFGSGTYNIASTNIYGTIIRLYPNNTSATHHDFTATGASIMGTLTTTGDQVISSDERLKTIVKPVDMTVEQLAGMRAVIYDRKDSGVRSLGVIAQDWEKVLPESVNQGEYLTFKYAQTAMVSAIVLAKHETEQDKEIRKLKARVRDLEKQLNIS